MSIEISHDHGYTWPGINSDFDSIGIAYGNGTWIALQQYNGFYTSVDNGDTWTSGSFLGGVGFSRIRYCGNYFVALKNNIFQFSTDGITWQEITGPYANSTLVDIASDGTNYALCYEDYSVYSATDLSGAWTARHGAKSGNNYNIAKCITYANGYWVVIDGSIYSEAYYNAIYSTDLITWTEIIQLWSKGTEGNVGIAYGSGHFVRAGKNWSGTNPFLLYNAGGSPIPDTECSIIGTNMSLEDVVWTGQNFVGKGTDINISTGDTYLPMSVGISTDGINWIRKDPYAPAIESYLTCAKALNGRVLIGGRGQSSYPEIQVSDGEDLTIWTQHINLSPNQHMTIYDFEYTGQYYVFVGQIGSVYVSQFLSEWIPFQTGLPGETTEAIKGISTNDDHTRMILCSTDKENGQIYYVDLPLDLDQSSWIQSITGIDPTVDLYSILSLGDNNWITVGTNGSIYTSDDNGLSWTRRVAANSYTATFKNIAKDLSGVIVIVGDNAEIQYSSDNGATWTHADAAGGYTNYFYDITWGHGLFMICGNNGEVQTSQDGAIWEEKETVQPPQGYDPYYFNGAAYLANQFIIVGGNGAVQKVDFS